MICDLSNTKNNRGHATRLRLLNLHFVLMYRKGVGDVRVDISSKGFVMRVNEGAILLLRILILYFIQ